MVPPGRRCSARHYSRSAFRRRLASRCRARGLLRLALVSRQQHLPEDTPYLAGRERLAHAGRARPLEEGPGLRPQDVPGEEDEPADQAVAELLQPLVEPGAVQLGHPDVAEDEIVGLLEDPVERDLAVEDDIDLVVVQREN